MHARLFVSPVVHTIADTQHKGGWSYLYLHKYHVYISRFLRYMYVTAGEYV